MYQINEDLSIYVTRGDAALLPVRAYDKEGKPYTFLPGDTIHFTVYKKKKATDVVLDKRFTVETATQEVQVYLSGSDTKIGEVISKPTTYWYEVVLNEDTEPQTIIGYDQEEGAKLFILLPEGADAEDAEDYEPDEDERYMDYAALVREMAQLTYSQEQTHKAVAELHVTPQMYGAIGDGEADDTEAIQAALDAGNVYFPSGVYLVTTYTARRLCIPSNRHIRFAKGATLKGINADAEVSSVLYIKDADNVTIEGATIIGDVEENKSTAEGAGHGIHIQTSSNVTVKDCVIKNCFTDGIYTNGVNGVKIINTEFDNCGRSSCGTVCGKNVLIDGCRAKGCNRVAPKSGFYIEPNFSTDYIQEVTIRNCVTESMGGVGYYVTLRALNSGEDISACFENCADYGSNLALMVGPFSPTIAHGGYVKITNFTSVNAQVGPISIDEYSADNTPRVYFDGLTLINGNTLGNGISYGSAIVFTRGGGNIDFNKIRTEPNGKMYRGLYTAQELKKVTVNNHDFGYRHSEYCVNYRNGNSDTAEFNTTTSTGFEYSVVKITNAAVDFYKPKKVGVECELYFTGENSSFRVREHKIDGLATTAGQYVRMTSDIGFLKIKKVSDDMFAVIGQYGTFAN